MIGLVAYGAERYPPFYWSLVYAEMVCNQVYVLSSTRHLVGLDKPLGPRERPFPTRAADREQWARVVAHELRGWHGQGTHDLLVLSGRAHLQALVTAIGDWWGPDAWRAHVHAPLVGLSLPGRLRWLRRRIALGRNGAPPSAYAPTTVLPEEETRMPNVTAEGRA